MFTGIVEELGTVRAIRRHATGARLEIGARGVVKDAALGGSIAVNGCCLTVVEHSEDAWAADVVDETLHRTCLGDLQAGDCVNLERSVRLEDRLGGHLVQGHVDGVGRLAEYSRRDDGSATLSIQAPPDLLHYMVEKGSIAVDGISLTIAGLHAGSFTLALIPHTLSRTTLGIKRVGAAVNLEVDLIAKYVERLLTPDLAAQWNRESQERAGAWV